MTRRERIEKLIQALEESGWTFAAFFGISFLGWASGLADLPNLDALQAAGRAAFVAGLGAGAKGLLWYFTGTVAGEEDTE